MTDKSHELLEAALDHLHGMNSYEDCLLKNRIRAYLAGPEQDEEPKCSEHPNAPHGFDRNASHNANRYVCECEGWIPEPEQDDEPVATLDHNGNFKLLRMVGVTVGQPINLYTHPAPQRSFVQDEKLVGNPDTLDALEEKNK